VKIEMVAPALPAAGMEMVIAGLTRGLARRGHDVGVTCILYKGALAEALEKEGFRVTVAPTPGLRTILLPSNLRSWFRQRRPDVVHIHSGAWLKGARAAALADVPRVVFTMHGIDGSQPRYQSLLDRWAARTTTVAVAVSAAFEPYLSAEAHVPPERLRVIINGIDVQRFRPGPRSRALRSALGLSPTDVVIGHVARFAPVKNHVMLVNAFSALLRARPNAFLALVGDGQLRGDIEARVDALGIRNRVAFLGLRTDLPDVYRDLDVLVLPSFSEATSMSILEGMASGLPVVATAVGGTPEILGHGDAGVLVPTDDAPALAAALERLVDLPAERSRLGSLARARAEANYSEERMLDAYEAAYFGHGPS
jgi:glycosyltransferase involved in cell wall biosynthesis